MVFRLMLNLSIYLSKFKELKLLKLRDIYKINLFTYLYKNREKFENQSISHVYSTRSTHIHSCTSEFQRLTQTQNQSIKYQAPLNWNSLPLHVKDAPSLKSFRKRAKAFAISQYGNS